MAKRKVTTQNETNEPTALIRPSKAMKGKNIFTSLEVKELIELIAEKVVATPDKQKGIRAKIRKIGFYYSDFSSKKDGYTVADFEALISSGQIKISD